MSLTEGFVVGGVAFIVGALIMFILTRSQKIRILLDKESREQYRVLSDPDKLLEKLQEYEFYDDDGGKKGQKIDFEIVDGRIAVKV